VKLLKGQIQPGENSLSSEIHQVDYRDIPLNYCPAHKPVRVSLNERKKKEMGERGIGIKKQTLEEKRGY
jgi:hypothetical protein